VKYNLLQAIKFAPNSPLGVFGILLLVCTLLFSMVAMMYYQMQSQVLRQDAINTLRQQAEQVAHVLQTHLCAAEQLVASSAALVVGADRSDKANIEKLLINLLESSDSEIIYGIGAWFEPYQFDHKIQYFGPYVHREHNKPQNLLLTYEWSSADYNFPTQAWYEIAKQHAGQAVFTEPYFDTDLVYMSLVKAFYDQEDNFVGVVSVDMVLPQLQAYITKYNQQTKHKIYVTTANGFLLVHPLEQQIISKLAQQGEIVANLLDVPLSRLDQLFELENFYSLAVDVAYTNWQIHIAAEEQLLFAAEKRLFKLIIGLVIIAWLIAIIIWLILQRLNLQVQTNAVLEIIVQQRTAELLAANQNIAKLNQQLQAENLRMSAELDVTRRLQQMLLPKECELKQITELDIAGFMLPAEEVGGDYYDVLQSESGGRIIFGIGDVTGHGLESGMVMLMVQTAVRTLLANNVTDLQTFLNVLNDTLYRNVKRMDTDKNLTLLLLDYQNGLLSFSGQHEEVLHVVANGEVKRIDTLNLGFMLGLTPDISKFTNQVQMQLQPGEGLVLYTDGITEAHSIDDELYGIERLCSIIQQYWCDNSADYIVKAIVNDLHLHAGNFQDDVTLLVIKQI
jgi:serine phosphatase RsbU (regulator of sigma subunit)